MILVLTQGAQILDTWQEAGYCFECEDQFGLPFLKAGVAVLQEDYQQQAPVENATHPGHANAEKAVSKRQQGHGK